MSLDSPGAASSRSSCPRISACAPHRQRSIEHARACMCVVCVCARVRGRARADSAVREAFADALPLEEVTVRVTHCAPHSVTAQTRRPCPTHRPRARRGTGCAQHPPPTAGLRPDARKRAREGARARKSARARACARALRAKVRAREGVCADRTGGRAGGARLPRRVVAAEAGERGRQPRRRLRVDRVHLPPTRPRMDSHYRQNRFRVAGSESPLSLGKTPREGGRAGEKNR